MLRTLRLSALRAARVFALRDTFHCSHVDVDDLVQGRPRSQRPLYSGLLRRTTAPGSCRPLCRRLYSDLQADHGDIPQVTENKEKNGPGMAPASHW
jgi:hypothetical protein